MTKTLFIITLVNLTVCNQELSDYTKLITKQEKEINMLSRYLKYYSNIKHLQTSLHENLINIPSTEELDGL